MFLTKYFEEFKNRRSASSECRVLHGMFCKPCNIVIIKDSVPYTQPGQRGCSNWLGYIKTTPANCDIDIVSMIKWLCPTANLEDMKLRCFIFQDGFTALYIAEITHQTIIIETLIKVTHVIIKRTEEEQVSLFPLLCCNCKYISQGPFSTYPFHPITGSPKFSFLSSLIYSYTS